MTDKPFLTALSGKPLPVPPMWMMRQAGRYLPEYRELRSRVSGFMELAMTPDLATEVTLQPIRRFGFDAAILFSDILTIPHALGQNVTFEEGEGPRLPPLPAGPEGLATLRPDGMDRALQPVYETVRQIRSKLAAENFHKTALIGFSGAPWTLACYMIGGGGKDRDFTEARRRAYADPQTFQSLIDLLTDSVIEYLSGQIAAGAEAVQIFDSWAGILDPDQFRLWVTIPTRRIVRALSEIAPGIPVIGFARGCGQMQLPYVQETGIKAVQIDTGIPTGWAARVLQPLVTVQGNLDPVCLLAGGDPMVLTVERILSDLGKGPFVFNLGHGILPTTPIEHVEQLVKLVRG